MAVPDKTRTLDKHRPSTTFEHLETDCRDNGGGSRWAHYFEFAKLTCFAEPISDERAIEVAKKQMAENYSIHFHVWTPAKFRDFIERARERFFPQLALLEFSKTGMKASSSFRDAECQ